MDNPSSFPLQTDLIPEDILGKADIKLTREQKERIMWLVSQPQFRDFELYLQKKQAAKNKLMFSVMKSYDYESMKKYGWQALTYGEITGDLENMWKKMKSADEDEQIKPPQKK